MVSGGCVCITIANTMFIIIANTIFMIIADTIFITMADTICDLENPSISAMLSRHFRRFGSLDPPWAAYPDHPSPDVVRAIARAVRHVQAGAHDPLRAHARVRTFYDWAAVTGRTEHVYRAVMAAPERDLMERMRR